MTHLMELDDKMCKYEMDLSSIVEETEWTQFGLQIDRQMDKVKPAYPLKCVGGEYKKLEISSLFVGGNWGYENNWAGVTTVSIPTLSIDWG